MAGGRGVTVGVGVAVGDGVRVGVGAAVCVAAATLVASQSTNSRVQPAVVITTSKIKIDRRRNPQQS